MTKRKPFFFTFKGLSNSPIFQYLNFSFHRHFNTNHLLRLGQTKKHTRKLITRVMLLHTSQRFTSCITAINWCFLKKEYAITMADTIKYKKGVYHGVIDLFHACLLCGLKVLEPCKAAAKKLSP